VSDQPDLPEITVTAAVPGSGPAKQPRSVVRVNGKVVPGHISWSVTNNSFYEADTFRLVYSTSKLPIANDEIWFSEQTETFIEILAGYPSNPDKPDPSQLVSLIYGRIDDLEYDPVQQTLTLTGRDLTGAFIDAKIITDYANKKSSDIATLLAQEHNLQAKITPTKDYVGTYYDNDHMELRTGSEWDLLAKLARREGFVVFVSGQTLYFGPDTTGQGSTLKLNYQQPDSDHGSPRGNFESISFSRSQTVAKGITVTVQSAGVLNKSVKQSYPTAPKSIAAGKSSPYGATTNYYAYMPAGSTPMQCLARAEELYKEIISHAMKVKVTLPADLITSPTSTVIFAGTGTAFDQQYLVTVVTRSMSVDDGFTMDVDAQNASPNLALADEPPPTPPPPAPAEPDNSGNSDA